MLYAGVEDVKVVDGGMQAWKAAGYDVETKVNEQKAGGDNYSFGTTVPAHPEYILSAEDAKDKLQNDANFRLVSIRSTKEFEGEETGYGYIDYLSLPYRRNNKTQGKRAPPRARSSAYTRSRDSCQSATAPAGIKLRQHQSA